MRINWHYRFSGEAVRRLSAAACVAVLAVGIIAMIHGRETEHNKVPPTPSPTLAAGQAHEREMFMCWLHAQMLIVDIETSGKTAIVNVGASWDFLSEGNADLYAAIIHMYASEKYGTRKTIYIDRDKIIKSLN